MSGIHYYRNASLPLLEAKRCEAYAISYKKHFHEEHSIGLIDKGTSKVWCDGKKLQVEAGSVLCFPAYMPHACSPESNYNWTYKMLFIHPKWIQSAFREDTSPDIPFLFQNHNNKRAAACVNQCVSTLETTMGPMETEVSFIDMIRTIKDNDSENIKHVRHASLPKHLNLIKDYLHEHFKEKITLDDLERETGISKFHLSHLFKKGSSLPPHAYLNLLRINYAKKELSRSRPIADIALEAGFYDQSHMTKLFINTVGLPPQKYASSIRV
ncbi:AraC family transcriptional regulator [Paenibacillus sp. UNC451MF]|uniref:AraC family transcriptional regulator n=1 Tax=Paenibacillus sp. UNC451MF TaxID=1449063 RepID=UPI00048DC12F|nr:AraC family transcriptional regulator [Paenibacillus sp. UNC451MF]